MAAIDTGTEDLLGSLDEGVLTLTLNRPEARNAMSGAMTDALGKALARAELDPAVKCVVLTGAGKGFCAGGDVKGMASRGDGTVGDNTIDGAIHRQRVNQRATAGALFKMPKPTLAALPGAAAGAGLSLALACDLRIMASTRDHDHRVRPRRLLGRLRRHLFPDPAGRLGQGARALLPVGPRHRRRSAAAWPHQLGLRAGGAGGQDPRDRPAAGARARPSPTAT